MSAFGTEGITNKRLSSFGSNLSLDDERNFSAFIQTISQNLVAYGASHDITSKVTIKKRTLSLSSRDKEYLEAYTDEDFLIYIEKVEKNMRQLELENSLFQTFLFANEPSLLSGLSLATKIIAALDQIKPMKPLEPEDFNSPVSRGYPNFSEQGLRMNYSQRADLVSRAMEEINQTSLKEREKARKNKAKFTAEIEEATIRLNECKDSIEYFNQSVVEAVDPISQRVPAEKFTWYMNEWLKVARIMTEKIRSSNNSLSVQYIKAKHIYTQKVEVGECITEIDIEQLKVANMTLQDKIDSLNRTFIELKCMHGKSQLLLSNYKKYLHKLLHSIRLIKGAVDDTIATTKTFEKEILLTKQQLEQSMKEHKKIKELIANYKVPEVIEYIKVKHELCCLKKTMKVLKRRLNLLNITLNSNLHNMKKLTAKKKSSDSWFHHSFEI